MCIAWIHLKLKQKGTLHPFKMKHNGEKGSTSRSIRIVAKKPHFFRIILTPQHRQMLEIPANFVNEYRESLPNSVYLRIPASAEYWKVGLVKYEGKVWLQSGLQDFLDHHSVMCGHFLVFRYNGDSIFHVIIFDTSSTEIDYPISVSIRSGSVKGDLQDGFLASSKKRKNETSPCRKQTSKRKCTADVEDSLALRRAKAFECDKPSFIVLMRRTHVVEFFRLPIPAVHGSKYLKGQHGKEAFLHRPDGEAWPVKCYARNSSEAKFSSGWKDFVLDNELQEGDVCVFEMFSQVPNHYKVTIFRESSPCKTPNQKQIGKRKCTADVEVSLALRRAKAFQCDDPSFIVMMRRSYVEDWFRMWIPVAHASKYLKDQHGKEANLHRPDGETWPVNCYVPNPSKARFSSGWKDFVLDNKLQEGDVCVFEMFSQLPNHYKVTIFRRGESSGAN